MIAEYRLKIDWTFVFLLFLPIFYVFNQDLRTVQAEFFAVAALLMVGFMHVNKFIGLYVVYCVAQYIFLKQADISALTNLFFGAVIYHFIVKCTDTKNLKKYFLVFVGVLAINILWCLRQKFNLDPIFILRDQQFQKVMSEPSGFFGLPAFLGNYAAPVASLSLILGYWPLVFVLAALFFSKSTFSIFAAGLGVLFFLWFRKRIVFWGALLVIVPSVLFYSLKCDFPTGQFGRRIQAWQAVEREVYRSPVWGYGIGSYAKNNFMEVTPNHTVKLTANADEFKEFLMQETAKKGKPELSDFIKSNFNPRNLGVVKSEMQRNGMDFEQWGQAHNEFLQVLFDGGMIGLGIICLYLWNMFTRFWSYGRRNTIILALMGAFVSILIVSSGHFPFRLARLAGPFVCLLGFLDLCLIRARKTVESKWE